MKLERTGEAQEIFKQALADCTIERALERKMKTASRENSTLVFGEDSVDFAAIKHLRIVATGKAASEMLLGVLPRLPLPAACDVAGVLITPHRPETLPAGIDHFAGGHPVPNEASFAGARAALEMLRAAAKLEGAMCLYLISGGASAMMELPLDDAISLEDTVALHRLLVHCGASIEEINCVRKHFSAVKGGRLALAAGKTPSITVLVSDVPPQALDSLASGPTLPDSSTLEQCKAIIGRYRLAEQMPASVRRFMESAAMGETPKPGVLQPRVWKLLDSDDLAEAARRKACELGFHVIVDNGCDDWNFSDAADYLLNRLRELRKRQPRVCLLSAGEVTVRVPARFTGSDGDVPSRSTHVGGRNQHFALYAALQLGPADQGTAVLSAGSDGIDGNSQAAGAVVDWKLLAEADQRRAEAKAALDGFDSTTFLAEFDATIVTGATGNNLRDLRILLAAPVQ